MSTPIERPGQPYTPPPRDAAPLDPVQQALLRLLMDVFGDDICAEVADESAYQPVEAAEP